MQTHTLKLPSKTFLLGEYVVLDGGPSLILTTPPHFVIHAQPRDITSAPPPNPFHPQSPAGKWLQLHANFFENYHINFFDPHDGKGGFGASSAQFLGVYHTIHPIQKDIKAIQALLNAYWATFPSDTKPLPSGADLVAQLLGSSTPNQQREIIYWHRAQQQFSSSPWPFKNLQYCLIHTGHKQATHQHLTHLSAHALGQMTAIVEQSVAAFKSHHSEGFIETIEHYARWMQQENCVIPTTQSLLELLYQSKLIKAAKGCGALGADVILILADPEKMPLLFDRLHQLGHSRITC